MIRFAIHGTGRMAQALVKAVDQAPDSKVLALAGIKAPEWATEVPYYPGLDRLPELPDLLIDFTLPEGTRVAAAWCAAQRVPLVSGVTGLTADTMEILHDAAKVVPVLWSPNLSLGVNLLADLARRAAGVLDAGTPVRVDDVHHQWKKDAPSGTALMLGEVIAEQRGEEAAAIDYHSVREGEVVGEHTITFQMAGEELVLGHRAQNRSIFALGAINAGRWLVGQAPGLYSARDWLQAL